ncbi:hypothetical protein D3C71_1721280 [compost metagenome]
MQPSRATVDLFARDAPQVRYLRVGAEGRFLFGNRQHGTQVALARGDPLGFEGDLDILGPALAILGLSRQQPHELGTHLGRVRFGRFFAAPGAALQQCQCHEPRGE